MSEALTLADLAPLSRFVVWRNEESNGRVTKIPYTPGTTRKARAGDPSTWRTLAEAELSVPQLVNGLGGGVGIEFGDLGDGRAIGGIDYDTCRGADGTLELWASESIARFGSYTEISPSGTGVKQFFTYAAADLPDLLKAMQTEGGKAWKRGGGEHPPAIELYLQGRYFAITEQHLSETPAALMPVTKEVLLQLINVDGPAFARAAKKAPASGRKTITGNDGSRSAKAFRIGGKVKRAGGTFEEMTAELKADPETADWYREKAEGNGSRELHRIWDKVNGFDLTEDGIALAFTAAFHDQLRYCHTTGAWFEWSGKAWRRDERKRAFSWSRQICRQIAKAAGAQGNDLAKMAKAAFAAAVERFAQADEAFAVTASIWDSDQWLMGTPIGTLELKTGLVREANPADHITKLTAVAAATMADCPLWLRFLNEATGNDKELIRFLQQWCGYSLTGVTREHALLFVYGPGGNGKSVFLNVVSGILAEYGKTAPMDSFTASQSDKHPTDMAGMKGARLVTASETEEGRAWAEAKIKALTGGDVISARFMRQDFFEFQPEFKLTIVGNHKPILRNVDDAAKRRFNIVPFIRKPDAPDRELETKLRAEWPGIFRWMIEGCLDWQEHGLLRPKVVTEATADYFASQDTFGSWLVERCTIDTSLSSRPSALLTDFNDWAGKNGEPHATRKVFRSWAERQSGVRYKVIKGVDWIEGIGVKPPARSKQPNEDTQGGEGGHGLP